MERQTPSGENQNNPAGSEHAGLEQAPQNGEHIPFQYEVMYEQYVIPAENSLNTVDLPAGGHRPAANVRHSDAEEADDPEEEDSDYNAGLRAWQNDREAYEEFQRQYREMSERILYTENRARELQQRNEIMIQYARYQQMTSLSFEDMLNDLRGPN